MNRFARTIVVTALIGLGASGPAVADSGALDGKALRQAVSGKVVYLSLPFGMELPIVYGANGTMSGQVKAFAAALAGGEARADRGTWWISDDQLCQRWNSWMAGKAYCYQLSRRGGSVVWRRNDGRTGTARLGG